jgi:hypothetical protein
MRVATLPVQTVLSDKDWDDAGKNAVATITAAAAKFLIAFRGATKDLSVRLTSGTTPGEVVNHYGHIDFEASGASGTRVHKLKGKYQLATGHFLTRPSVKSASKVNAWVPTILPDTQWNDPAKNALATIAGAATKFLAQFPQAQDLKVQLTTGATRADVVEHYGHINFVVSGKQGDQVRELAGSYQLANGKLMFRPAQAL